ncbi:MAG: CocE/NonD family hydrolase [Solirubrobacterales bacterium]|nr:CocE/NonD family hydrolase [Solirubrobacterales bacterium]
MVTMRDGVALATDVYRPAGTSALPAIVQRTPYDKEFSALRNYSFEVMRAVQGGYACVVQDVRGRYLSQGHFDPFFDDGADGADTVAWVAAQPWCSGTVGMAGGSYFGATQWRAASERPDALRAVIPYVTAADYHEGWAYQGGAFELGFNLNWTLSFLAIGEVLRRLVAGHDATGQLQELVAAIDDNDALYRRRPLNDVPLLSELAPYYLKWLEHPDYDDYWSAVAPKERYGEMTVPALNIGGWYDLFLGGTIANYLGMKRHGATPAARRPRLVIGPWAHGDSVGWFAQRSYGFLSNYLALDPTALHLRWFDHYLKGVENGAGEDPPVQIFVMGIDAWRDERDWPLPDTSYTRYYLHSQGHANTAAGDGVLSPEPPDEQPHDTYLYDPRNPVPTLGGATFLPGLFVAANAGPLDQRPLAGRADVLTYATAPLEHDVEVTGPVELVLFASSTANDTDFTGKLIDLHPDGRAEILTDGILRARYRDSMSDPKPLEPNKVYELRIDLWATANVFRAGHRIRLDVSSSNFPRFDANTNTGGTIASEGRDDGVEAVNRVFHDRSHPSHVVLPIIDRR